MKRWQKITGVVVTGVVTAVVGLMLMITRQEAHNLITNPPDERHLSGKTPADYGLPCEVVTVISADGLALAGWYIPTQNGAVVMAQHGYKGTREEMLEEAEMLARHGYGVLITSARAHEENGGELITFGYYEMQDLEAFYQYLLTRDEVDPNKIGILGNSMGGSMAIQYASQNNQIRAVVAHSAFSSLDDTISTSVPHFTGLPAFPFAPLILWWAEQETGMDSRLINAAEWIGDISPRPVFLMQGGADTVISATGGQILYDAAGQPKELWYEQEVGHTAFDTTFPEEYERRVIDFYDRYLLAAK